MWMAMGGLTWLSVRPEMMMELLTLGMKSDQMTSDQMRQDETRQDKIR
jgi:hypothetical protein